MGSVLVLSPRFSSRLVAVLGIVLLTGGVANAGFVLPYELRIGPAKTPERFTVLVFLPERYRKQWGPTDGLWRLLPRNDHGTRNRFARAYLPRTYAWHLAQVDMHRDIYGEDTEKMLESLRQHHGVDPEGGAVVITRFRQLAETVAWLRVTDPDATGLLPTNGQFLNDGLNGELFPETEPVFHWNPIASFEPVPGLPAVFDVTRARTFRRVLGVKGTKLEFNNFGMLPELRGRLMIYLFHLLWSHQLFALGKGPLPEKLTEWPSGTAITDADRAGLGLWVSELWLGTYGKVLMRLYRSLGFRVWRELVLPQWQKPIYLMRGSPSGFSRAIRRMKPGGGPEDRYHLVHDDWLSPRIRRFDCEDQLALGLPEFGLVP